MTKIDTERVTQYGVFEESFIDLHPFVIPASLIFCDRPVLGRRGFLCLIQIQNSLSSMPSMTD